MYHSSIESLINITQSCSRVICTNILIKKTTKSSRRLIKSDEKFAEIYFPHFSMFLSFLFLLIRYLSLERETNRRVPEWEKKQTTRKKTES